MGPIFGLTLIMLITSFGSVKATCRRTDNDVLIEYYCVGGQLSDLNILPEAAEKIRIMNIPIRRITANIFSRFGANLLVLGCSYCSVTDIDPDAFSRLPNLEQLSLNNNYLTIVKESWSRHLGSLTYLDLNYNRIRTIEDGVFKNLRELVDFRISGNQLECLNLRDMSHLSELRRIFLNENPEFKCPNAVSAFLDEHNIGFDKDPEWRRIPVDLVPAEIPTKYDDHRWKTYSTEHPTPPPRESQWTTSPRPMYPPMYATPNSRPTFAPHATLPSHHVESNTHPTIYRPYYDDEITSAPRLIPTTEATTHPPYTPTRPVSTAEITTYPPYTPPRRVSTVEVTTHPPYIPPRLIPTAEVTTHPPYIPPRLIPTAEVTTHPPYIPPRLIPTAEVTTHPSYIPPRLIPTAEVTTHPPYIPPRLIPTAEVTTHPPYIPPRPVPTAEVTTHPPYIPSRPVPTAEVTTHPPYISPRIFPTVETTTYLPYIPSPISTTEITTYPHTPPGPVPIMETTYHPSYTPSRTIPTTSTAIHLSPTEATSSDLVTPNISQTPISVNAQFTEPPITLSPRTSLSTSAATHPPYMPSSEVFDMAPRPWLESTQSSIATSVESSHRSHEQEDSHYEQPRYPSDVYRPPLLAPSPMDHQGTPIFVETNMERTTGTYEVYPRPDDDEDTPSSNPHPQSEPQEQSVSPTSEFSTTTFVRPVPAVEPEWVQAAGPGDMFHAPYYEPTVTTRPPAIIQQRKEEQTITVSPVETTTDKPLPQCPNASSSLTLYLWTILLAVLVVANNILLEEI
ncbi:hypothetical protein KM043_006949 [Ampulex compressa]|nr:hypothetical protein KM043_006949 [Ampulex compressa]